jgi:hypothetical protein
MILLNFAHPLTHEHLAQIEALIGRKIERVVAIDSQIDPQQPLIPQVMALAEQCGLSPIEWQTLPLLINPPSLHWVAVTLLAEIHGRCGYFPAHIRLRPVQGAITGGYEVAEMLDLQALRNEARQKRIT